MGLTNEQIAENLRPIGDVRWVLRNDGIYWLHHQLPNDLEPWLEDFRTAVHVTADKKGRLRKWTSQKLMQS